MKIIRPFTLMAIRGDGRAATTGKPERVSINAAASSLAIRGKSASGERLITGPKTSVFFGAGDKNPAPSSVASNRAPLCRKGHDRRWIYCAPESGRTQYPLD